MKIQTDDLEYTGERFHPAVAGHIAFEHLHRYYFAREFVGGMRVLDVACGEGYGSNLLSLVAKHVVGVDIDADAVAHASEKYSADNVSFVSASAAELPFVNEEFDAVVSFETIEHHDQHEEMLSEIKRVLKPGGLVIVSSPDKQHYSIEPSYQNPFHVKELFRDEFLQLMQRYFKFSSLLTQRVVHGSLIVMSDCPSGFQSHTLDSETIRLEPGLRAPLYDIVVASDFPLPNVSSSLFESTTHGMAPADFYGVHLPDRVSKADALVAVLEGQLELRPMPGGEARAHFAGLSGRLQELTEGNLPAIADVVRAELAGREAVIAQMQQLSAEKEVRLESGAHLLNERNAAIAELRTHVNALESLRGEYESRLQVYGLETAVLRAEREGRDRMISQLDHQRAADMQASADAAAKREDEWKVRESVLQQELESLHGGLETSNRKLSQLMEEQNESSNVILRLRDELNGSIIGREQLLIEIAGCCASLDEVHQSTSWRLTKPLRWFGQRLVRG